jgi:DNA-binding response OmpR family regulator
MPRVLLVEDSSTYARGVVYLLNQGGHTVDVATDGNTGLQKALTNRYDLIILDVNLPGMSGPDICLEYRAAGHTDTPIIVCTTQDQLSAPIGGLTSGAYYFVIKDNNGASNLNARAESIFLRQSRRAKISA